MKRFIATLAVAAFAATFVMASAQAKMKLKMGHLQPAVSEQGPAISHMAKRIGELTNGEIEVQVFHAAELGKSVPVQFENLVSGAQDFFIETMDYFKQWDERFGVVNTPFVFRDRDHFRAFLASDIFADIVKNIEKQGVVFIGSPNYNWMRASYRGILSKKPIFKPADLKGYKMRMFQAEMPIKAWGSFGNSIQVIPWADVYTSLATGVVDSLTTPLLNAYEMKFVEHAKYFTELREYYQIFAPMISKRTWDKLNAQQRKAVEQAAFEGGEIYTATSIKQSVSKQVKAQNEYGVSVILPPLGPWQKHMAKVHAEFEANGDLPKGLIAKIQALK
ncbi:MAG: TRAP transporter substrate-binding protein [Rhodospirillales bacterium]|jgi:TRAP-type C4-dicarboxylate transport system substrate-binding protein|nr:TRAP transporter substrate-binding protein [Rhodospirillales bacterium]